MIKTFIAILLILFINVPANGKTLGYEDSLSATVGSIVKGAKDKSIQKIAVINFIDTTSKQRFLLSDILEEDFTTKLIQSKRFDVIVKNRINQKATGSVLEMGINVPGCPLCKRLNIQRV